LTVQPMPTIGDEITNSVYFDNVYVGDEYRVGELNKGFQYISEALDLERFTMFTFSPIEQRLEELCAHVATEERDGKPLRDDPVIRQRIAQLVTQAEVARVLGLRFVAKSMQGGAAPTTDASQYKLYATELSKRVANAALDIAGVAAQLRVNTEDAPMRGRAELTYRYTVIDTIGGGTSEVQKNIIARRKLGLPPNF
jgi:alkylation response protein AidB-like acyl-CoA dehydrogenase